jgi:hypothetical protein
MPTLTIAFLGSFLGTFAALVAHTKFTVWRMARLKRKFEESFLAELSRRDIGLARTIRRGGDREMN